MKKNIFIRLTVLILAASSLASCDKEPKIDQNQLFIDKMKAVTDSIIQNTHVPGIVALVVDHKRDIDWLYAAGYSDIPSKLPMDGSNIFRIASNTKTFTGTVLLQLVDEGKLSLTDKLSKFYPDFPEAESITIAMLCNMSSGINDYTGNPVWQYSNTNTIILGMIIEKLTGNTLESEVENRIVKPLKLNNTGFLTSGLDLPGKHGRGYYAGEYEEDGDYTEFFDISSAWAAGSAYSTPRELQKFAEALVKGTLLSNTLHQRRLNDMIMLSPTVGYGLCLLKRGSFYGHGGAIPGFTSAMYHSIEKNCTVIIYFNCQLEIHPEDLFARFVNILYPDESS